MIRVLSSSSVCHARCVVDSTSDLFMFHAFRWHGNIWPCQPHIICFTNLIIEVKEAGPTLLHPTEPKTSCHIFQDNVGALELANTHKLRDTKHLAVQLHHFCQCKLLQLANARKDLSKPDEVWLILWSVA